MRGGKTAQSGQALVLVAVALLALIGSAALVLLAGSVEWQRNQLQTLADSTALDSALKVGTGCTAAGATTVITEADTFLATQRTRTGSLAIAAGTCATPYHGTDTFAGGLSADYYYPYHAHQQQVQVVLTLSLPISFGGEVGKTSTTVIRYAVAEALPAAVPALSATTINCTGGQVNVAGDIAAQSAVSLSGGCALYAHQRLSGGAYSSLGNTHVYADGQAWLAGGGACIAGANSGSLSAICSDGYELSGHVTPACGPATTSYLSAANLVVNANPCAAGVGPQPVAPLSSALPPEPNTDPRAIATLQGTGGAACTPGAVYPNIVVSGTTVATGLAPVPLQDASGYYHFKPSCYGYLNPSLLSSHEAVLDPGFYYFNGSGFAGGGGVCLGGQKLLARDVTLEFVNQAGFSSGTCIPGGAGPSTFWLQGTNNCAAPGCHLQTTDPASGQQSVKFNPPVTTVIWSETVSSPSAQTVPASTSYTLTYSSNGGRTINATITLYYSVATPCAAPTGATNLVSWSAALPDASGVGGSTVTSPASGVPVVIPAGAFLCLAVAGNTTTGNENFLFNDTNHPGKISTTATILPAVQVVACAAGCQLGSTPCSVSVCPPNAGADAPNNLTWFAAPCSSAPAAADAASCPGSAWCPAGDRSCWNELVWAPATVSGQVAIAGSGVSAWLLGSIDWPGTCTYQVKTTTTIGGKLYCGTLSISAVAGAGTAVGGDAGINTAQVEARLVE